jgi:hypothetical protein
MLLSRSAVVEDDRGGLAAQLERHWAQQASARLGDRSPCCGGAGERDLVDARMRDEMRAELSATLHDVQDPGRQPGLFGGLGDDVLVEHRLGRRLDHHGAAAGQCRSDLREGQCLWHDRHDDADRFPKDAGRAAEHAFPRLLERPVLCHLRVVAQQQRREDRFDDGGQRPRHAVLQRHAACGLLAALLERDGEALEHLGSLRWAAGRAAGGIVERPPRRGDRRIHVRRRGLWDAPVNVLGAWRHHGDRLAGGGRSPLTADVEGVVGQLLGDAVSALCPSRCPVLVATAEPRTRN